MTTWYECSTLAEAEAVDAVAEVFGRVGQGVAIEEPIYSSPDGEQVIVLTDRPVLVKTYLPDDERTSDRRQQLEQAIWHLGRLRRVDPMRVEKLQETDWADAWKRHFFVHHVGKRLVIVPSWRRHRRAPGELVLRLDPGMAFGTGLHPTTRLSLQALERSACANAAVLDLGTGSGVLAIAAAKLGAKRVLALDVEPIAVKVARENVVRNRQARRVETRAGSLPLDPLTGERFDLLVANISLRVLLALRRELAEILRPGGRALLSGVLEVDAPRLVESYVGAGWRLDEQRNEAEWCLLAVAPPV